MAKHTPGQRDRSRPKDVPCVFAAGDGCKNVGVPDKKGRFVCETCTERFFRILAQLHAETN